MLKLRVAEACVEVNTDSPGALVDALKSSFARRYLPPMIVDECTRVEARIEWLRGGEFQVLSASYSSGGVDNYVVRGDYPEPYANESPVFFFLQVLARSLAKKGYVMLTDSIAIGLNNKNVLFLGFPHTGKSTISAIAVSKGYVVYSTENTVVKVLNGVIHVVAGTRVLVFDPRIRGLYGVEIKSTGKTRHGYEILDLDTVSSPPRDSLLVPVNEIYVIYTSFNSSGVSIVSIKGRKVEKLLWYFAAGLIKGLDFYYPRPLDMPIDKQVARSISEFLEAAKSNYADKFFEVFGSPLEVLLYVASVPPR